MKTWKKTSLYPVGPYARLTDGIKNVSKKWKSATAMLIAAVILCGMFPITATAAYATKVKVSGTELTETGYYTVSSETVGSKQDTEPAEGSGYVHWDEANHTLTLYGVTVDGGSTSSGIFANGDYTIKLAEGTDNTVRSDYTNAITCDAGSVVIEGTGTMTAIGATNGIKAQYSVVISANVTVTGNNGCGIVNSPTVFSNNADPIRITAAATVSVTGSTYGISVEGGYGASPVIDSPNVTITGGTAAFKAFPHGAPKLSGDIGVSAGENESNLEAYDSASYSTYKCVKTRNLATYTVTFDANGGSGSMDSATATESKEYTLPACTFTAPAGKTFKAWSVNGSEKAVGDKVVFVENATVTAVWEEVVVPETYTISYDANGGTNAPESQTKTEGVDTTLSSAVPTREGYVFLGWAKSKDSDTKEYDPADNYTADADITLYAVWLAEDVDLAFGDVNFDGSINSLDAAYVLKYDAFMLTLDDTQLLTADVNGDGNVNSLDAAQILKYDAMIIDRFPAEQ